MRNLIFLILTALLAVTVYAQDDGAGGEDVASQFEGNPQYPAPDFPTRVDWLNVPAPLTIDGLRGKMVLLDFWTYGCINCIHMIPILEQLEEKYADTLVVIGVHSAKFENEGVTENIRQIVQRYGLEHPVINDSEFRVWNTYRQYGVNAWPTFVLIDPRGNLYAVQAGEIPFEVFDRVIGGMEAHFDSLGELNREPVELALEGAAVPSQALAFPGKVLADAEGNRLFIADSNHHRIVIADLTTYEVLDVIGSGQRGLDDGSYETATFNTPQGMALNDSTLYVADTNNHVLRAVDLEARAVTTIAGTGEQSYERNAAGAPDEIALNSPWDVEFGPSDNVLYIAMAGPHQLWALIFDRNLIGPLIGSGREGLLDGPFNEAELAQPSGLYYRDGMLYFADSESSSIRVADLGASEVRTLAGPTTNNLFDFGDVDGELGVSRLQHPLGVTGGPDGLLYVADTYNSKIKVLDPETNEIRTVFGLGGTGGFRDGGANVAAFDEPGGLDYANGRLYVADTNNHAIRVIDLEANEVTTVAFPNPEALQIGEQTTVIGGNAAEGLQITLPEQTVAAGEGEIVLEITLPEGYKLNNLAPFTSQWTTSGEAIQISEEHRAQRIVEPELPIRVPVTLTEGSDLLHGELTIYYCEAEQQNLCFIDQIGIDAPVTVSAAGNEPRIVIERVIEPPQLPEGSGF
jgi:DNA-binding beta-propeller fold protein YncE